MVTVLIGIDFNLVQLLLLELPMIAFALAPRRTPRAIDRVKSWTQKHWRRYAAAGLALAGAMLTLRGILQLG